MGRYDDRDLFKKLNKEKPLVKQMERSGPSGFAVKKMDMGAQKAEQQRPVDVLNTRSADDVPKNAGAQHRFKEFTASPARNVDTRQELKTDFSENRRSAAPSAPPHERRPQPQAPSYEREARRDIKPSFAVAGQKNVSGEPVGQARYELGPAQKKKQRSYRHELKYYINPGDYEMLKSAMSSLLLPDQNAVNGGYHIRSLYFDDFENNAMMEKINGVKHRKKYRIRLYNHSAGFIRLERKLKDGEFVSKDNMVLTKQEAESILNGDYGFLIDKDNKLAHDFFVELQTRGLRPATIVDYYREAYVHPIEDVRITFDSDLRSGVFDKNIFNENLQTVPMYEDNLIVMEVKFNHYLPQYIKVILNNAQSASRSAVSKYVICRQYD